MTSYFDNIDSLIIIKNRMSEASFVIFITHEIQMVQSRLGSFFRVQMDTNSSVKLIKGNHGIVTTVL